MKFSRMMTGLLAVSLMSLVVSDACGQDRRGDDGDRRGRGGFGQRGPGGGGFGGPRGGGDPLLGLLRVEEVKEEIELMPDQEEAIGKLAESIERPDFDFSNFRQMSDEERREAFEKMQQQRAEVAKKTREQLEQVLLPGQMERLEQISLQMRGVNALREPEVAEKLGLSQAQQEQLANVQEELGQEMRSKMGELFRSGDREKIGEEMAKMREQMESKTLEVLTAEQKTKFEEMKGEAFEMPERGGFGGFGGGGRGGFRGRPGGGPGGDGDRRRGRPEVE